MTRWRNRAGHSSISGSRLDCLPRLIEICARQKNRDETLRESREREKSGAVLERRDDRERERGRRGFGLALPKPATQIPIDPPTHITGVGGVRPDGKGEREREKSYPPHYEHCVTTNLYPFPILF